MLSGFVRTHAEEIRRVMRYLLAGGANTLLGYGLIVLFMEVFGLSPHVSNLMAYTITFFTSFALQRSVTFRSAGDPRAEILRFTVVYVGAFLVNFVALTGFVDLMPKLLAQIAASVVFVVASYCGQRLYVFSHRGDRRS